MKKISFKFNSSAFKHLPTYFLYKYFLCNRASVWRGIFVVVQFFSLSNTYQRFFTQIFFYVSSITLGSWNRGWICLATHSGKHSEAQSGSWSADRGVRIVECGSWSAVDYTGRPKAESPLSQGPRPVFENLIYWRVRAQTRLPQFPETSLNKGKERYNQI